MNSFHATYSAAWKALKTAKAQTAPLPADLVARLKAERPAEYAKCEQEVAAIAATIPALQAEYDLLSDLACSRCAGTGEYGGASRYMRGGKKFCFDCNGSGKHS